jgi:hypothetical protein
LEWFKKSFSYTVDEIDQLTQTINEQGSEQRKAMSAFSKAMNNFAAERSLETCLEALNTSIQIANIRGKLVESYEYYARLLEKEITRINKPQNKERRA